MQMISKDDIVILCQSVQSLVKQTVPWERQFFIKTN